MTSVSTDRRFGINSGAAVKVPCRCATTAAITLNGLQPIDGITVAADDRVLVKNQASSIANGIYSASTGNWLRAPDFDGKFDVKSGTLVLVNGGTANGSRSWRLTTADPVTIGSSALTFALADVGGGTPLDDAFLTVQRTEASATATTQHQANQVAALNVLIFDATIDNTGVADVTTKLQAAINAATGKRVYIPAGTYLTNVITIPSYTIVFGEGPNTIIKPAAVPGSNPFWQTANGGQFCEISHLQFQLPKATYPNQWVIYLQAASWAYVHDVYIPTSGGEAIHALNCLDCKIERVTTLLPGAQNIVISDTGGGNVSVRCKVLNCYVDATGGSGHGIAVQGNDIEVLSNFVTGANTFNISYNLSSRGKCALNTCSQSKHEAINAQDSSNIEIADNICYWTGGVSTDFGISVNALNVNTLNNKVSRNQISACNKSGIALAGGATFGTLYCDVSDNIVVNCSQANIGFTSASGAGVIIYSSATSNNVVQGNTIYDNAGFLVHGVAEFNLNGLPSANKIFGNYVYGASGAVVNKQAASTIEALTSGIKTWTPTVTSGTGAITTSTVNLAQYYEVEKLVHFFFSVTITTNGTGATSINFTLPFTANIDCIAVGHEIALTGSILKGRVAAASNSMAVTTYNNAYPGGNGAIIEATGTFVRQ